MTYTGQVLSIEENADSFTKKGGQGGVAHCHYLKLLVVGFEDEGEYEAQIVTDHATLDRFMPNDSIKFTTTAFGKGKYTIQFNELATKHIVSRKWMPVDESPREQIDRPPARVVIVTGTKIDRAMSHAAHLLQMQGGLTNTDTGVKIFLAYVKAIMDEYEKYFPEVI